jgi:hypothetical protein
LPARGFSLSLRRVTTIRAIVASIDLRVLAPRPPDGRAAGVVVTHEDAILLLRQARATELVHFVVAVGLSVFTDVVAGHELVSSVWAEWIEYAEHFTLSE